MLRSSEVEVILGVFVTTSDIFCRALVRFLFLRERFQGRFSARVCFFVSDIAKNLIWRYLLLKDVVFGAPT